MNRERTAYHEAGHSTVARAVGHRTGPVTIRAGVAWAGCSWSTPRRQRAADVAQVDVRQPFELWPARIRTGIARRALVLAAGDAAAREFTPHATGRVSPAVVEAAVDRLEHVPELTAAEALTIDSARADTVAESDDEQLWRLAWLAHGADHASAAEWLRYIEAQARALVAVHRPDVERLAHLLMANESLSAAAVRQVLR